MNEIWVENDIFGITNLWPNIQPGEFLSDERTGFACAALSFVVDDAPDDESPDEKQGGKSDSGV